MIWDTYGIHVGYVSEEDKEEDAEIGDRSGYKTSATPPTPATKAGAGPRSRMNATEFGQIAAPTGTVCTETEQDKSRLSYHIKATYSIIHACTPNAMRTCRYMLYQEVC